MVPATRRPALLKRVLAEAYVPQVQPPPQPQLGQPLLIRVADQGGDWLMDNGLMA